jgi:hypothetical protein
MLESIISCANPLGVLVSLAYVLSAIALATAEALAKFAWPEVL